MIKKIWKDPVWGAVIATGITFLVGTFAAYLFGILPNIKNISLSIYNFITSSATIPTWFFGLLLIPNLLFVIVVIFFVKHKISETQSNTSYKTYINDNFLNLKWGWSYFSDGGIYDLHSLCPNCDYQIIPKYIDSMQYLFICDECSYSAGSLQGDFEQKIKLKIQQKLRTGTWNKT